MGSTLKNSGLVSLGAIAGIALSMQFSALAQKPVEPSMPIEELRQLADVYGLIKSDYVESVEDKKLLTEAISGMVASLDPHSAYLDKKAYRDLREGTEGKFVGLGIEIAASDEGYIRIVAPIEDSPAWRAGIKAGDLITRIDNVPIQGLGIEDAIKKMRGEAGTKVTLSIMRKESPLPLALTIAREEVIQKSVKGKIVEPGYAWLRISQFQEPTLDDMVTKIIALYKQEPNLKGLVLDLRNDPGGLLQGAVGVSAAFLPRGAEIVSTNGQLAESRVRYLGQPRDYSFTSADLAGRAENRAACGAGQHRLGLGIRDRGRRAAGLQARRHHGQPNLRQGLGPDHPRAHRRHRDKAHHGALLHAQGPGHPGARHHARPSG
jgi:carboxyl-terminal processing protease